MIAVGQTTVTLMSKDFQLIVSLMTFGENTLGFLFGWGFFELRKFWDTT